MRRLSLKFPYTGQQTSPLDYGLLLLGLVFLVATVLHLKSIMEEISYWETRADRFENAQQQKRAPKTSSSRTNQESQQELKQAREIMKQLNLPWEVLFDSLEYTVTKDIALLSVQPSVANQSIRINGEARNLAALTEFVESMEREAFFENAHILSYKVKQENPHRPILFSLITSWIDTP